MRSNVVAFLILTVWTCSVTSLHGQAADPSVKLKAMMDATALDSDGVGPWHWKMDVMAYDSSGSNPKAGSIEVWRAGGNMRTVMTLDRTEITTLRVGNELYRSDGDAKKVQPLEAVFMQVLNPIPGELLDPAVKLKFVQRKAGKAKLDCIETTIKTPDANTFAPERPVAFCALPDTSHFVEANGADKSVLTIGQFGTYQSEQVPVTFQVSSFGHMYAEGKTTAFSSYTPAPDDFTQQEGMHRLELPMVINFPPFALVHDIALYPAGAKSRHAEGQVKLDVLIGEDGKVVSHTVAQAASDPELTQATEKALTHLILRPYLVDGIAVQAKLTVVMNFSIGN
jgi:TonB family protein